MSNMEKIIMEHTRLVKEFDNLTLNGGNTLEEAEIIKMRKNQIKKRIHEIKEQLLYKQYLELQSKEFKEDIIDYESFKEPAKDVCIKINFTWGWLRVYRNKDNQIEWY